MANRTPKEILTAHKQLMRARESYEPLKRLCTMVSYPLRSDVWDVKSEMKGKMRGQQLYDPTASKSLDLWGSGIMGHYAPAQMQGGWFRQIMNRKLMESKRVRTWLQETDEHMQSVLARGTYYEAKKVTVTDSAAIGDSYMCIDEDLETGKLMCLAPHPRQFFVKRDFFGRIVEIHRKFDKTITQLKDEFGVNSLSDEQKLKLENSPDQEVEVIQATDRNPGYNPSEQGARHMKWRTYFIQTGSTEEGEGRMIKSGGYRTLNPIPWSLNRVTHEDYGRGIVSSMMHAILTTNYIMKDMISVSAQAARPTMIISSALKHRWSRTPGKDIFADAEALMGIKMGDLIAKAVDTSGYPFGIDMLHYFQSVIEDFFGVPLFLAMNMQQDVVKTATEVRERKAERAVLMAPFLGTLGTTTDAELDRVYSIEINALDNMGKPRAPEPPMEVIAAQDGRIDIQNIGPLHQLLNFYYGTANILETIANMQAVALLYPDSIAVADGDKMMYKILRSGNTPEEIIFEPDEVLEIRAIAAQQQEAIMMAELAAKAGQANTGLSKAPEAGSPAEALVA